MGRLEGKVAFVTGAGSGFGEAIAKAYAAEGAKVVIADISDSGKRVASEIGSSAAFVKCDVTSKQSWEQGLEFTLSTFGKLDILINNAGTTYKKKPSVDVTEKEFDLIVNVNIKSIYLSIAVIMPYFVKQKSGVVLNTSSAAAMRVRPGQVLYGGTKGFVTTVRDGHFMGAD